MTTRTSRRRSQRNGNGNLDVTHVRTLNNLFDVSPDANENLQESNVSDFVVPPATRKSKRIKLLKKETPEWMCDLPSENEQSSEDDYAASHATSSEDEDDDAGDDDNDEDDITSISSDQSNILSDYPQRRSSVKIRAKSGMKFTKTFCRSNSSKRLDVFPNGMKWTFEQMRELELKFNTCHPEMLPHASKFSQTTGKFDFQQSPSFKIISEDQKVIVDSCVLDELCAAPVSKAGDELIFCVGGPVTTLSWCPRSISMLGSKQYIAISTNFGLHSPTRTYREQSLIQLWDCGVLEVSGHKAFTPKVAMKICVPEGPVWELKWCTVGGYSNANNGLTRLGILAAACASGHVLLISLPDPDSHPEYSNEQTYNVTPDFTLVPCSNNPSEIENLFGQCLCIEWNLKSGGKWLAGGYSKGVVALWNIRPLSNILQQCFPGQQNEIVACRTFTAHIQLVRSVCWCPFDENIFATAGSDSFVKVWNRESIHSPVLEISTKIGSVTEIVWPMIWCCLITSTDVVFARPTASGVVYIDIMTQLQNPNNLIPFKSCCQSVSFSNWLNICVGVDSTGLAIMYFANFLNRGIHRSRSGKPEPRIISTSLSLEWNSPNDTSEDNDKFHLTFRDSNFDYVTKIRQRPICADAKFLDSVPTAIIDKPFVQSANCVSWNPNFGSHTWYCTGFQCGLVRVQSIKAFHNSVMDIYTELLEMIK